MSDENRSGEWSSALGSAMERQVTRRFAMTLEKESQAAKMSTEPDGNLVDAVKKVVEDHEPKD